MRLLTPERIVAEKRLADALLREVGTTGALEAQAAELRARIVDLEKVIADRQPLFRQFPLTVGCPCSAADGTINENCEQCAGTGWLEVKL